MPDQHNKKLSAWVLSALFSAGASGAYAQSEGAGGLDVVVVTAEKSAASSQDVPLVVNAFSGADLRDAGLDDVGDIVSQVPNVNLLDATGGGVPTVFIRGVGLADFRVNNSPAAAFYVDEVYKPSVAQIASTFFDLERVEVLKGPQGGLYGRNTTAGAFQIVSAKPNLDEFGGFATIGYGRFDRKEVEGAINAPFGSAAALRVAGRVVKSDDAFSRSVSASATPDEQFVSGGSRHGEADQWALRGQLLIEPNDRLSVLLKGYAGEDLSETTLLRPIGFWAPGDADGDRFADAVFSNNVCAPLLMGQRDDAACVTITGQTIGELGLQDEFDTASSNLNALNNDWIGGVARFDWQVTDRFTLTSITSYEDFEHGRLTDWDAIDAAYQDIRYASEITALSQELRVAYAGENWDFIGGFNYAAEKLEEDTVLFAARGLVPIAFGFQETVQRYEQDTEATAVFGRLDWAVADQLSLVGEFRYTWEEKSFAGATNLRSPVGSSDTTTEFPFVDVSQPDASFDDFSGKVSVEFRPSENVLTYASLSRGFKSGGFPGGIVLSAADASAYDPEVINAVEAGVKSDFWEQRVRANASVFYYDYSDLQGSARVPSAGGVVLDRFQNIGDAEVYGFDAELTVLATDYMLIGAQVGFAEGEITSSDAVQPSPLTGVEFALEGQELRYKPDASVRAYARYTVPLGAYGEAYAQLDYDWRSEQNFAFIGGPADEAIFNEDGYGLLNLQLGFQDASEKWRLSAFIKNLTDERYRTNARTDALGGAFEIYGAPRIWGMTASREF